MRELQSHQGNREEESGERVLRCFDAFAGVGGFTIGIHAALPNAVTVGFSEIDKHASAVLKYRFPNVKNYGDITSLDPKELPDFDLFTFGSPCQDFSIAGKRAGIGGARSGLFLRAIEVIREKKPEYFIFENVKGMLSSNRGWDFGRAILEMETSGYSLSIQLLNAKHFGVPQNRERVFVVGHLGAEPPRKVFFVPNDDGVHPPAPPTEEKIHDVAQAQTARQYASWGGDYAVIDDYNGNLKNDGIIPAVRQTFGNKAPGNGAKVLEITTGHDQAHRVYDPDGIHRTLAANGGGLGAKMGLTLDDARIRRLTPSECSLLMSWPSDWTQWGDYGNGKKEISDSQRYKMAGNGVVSAVVAELVKAHF